MSYHYCCSKVSSISEVSCFRRLRSRRNGGKRSHYIDATMIRRTPIISRMSSRRCLSHFISFPFRWTRIGRYAFPSFQRVLYILLDPCIYTDQARCEAIPALLCWCKIYRREREITVPCTVLFGSIEQLLELRWKKKRTLSSIFSVGSTGRSIYHNRFSLGLRECRIDDDAWIERERESPSVDLSWCVRFFLFRFVSRSIKRCSFLKFVMIHWQTKREKERVSESERPSPLPTNEQNNSNSLLLYTILYLNLKEKIERECGPQPFIFIYRIM